MALAMGHESQKMTHFHFWYWHLASKSIVGYLPGCRI